MFDINLLREYSELDRKKKKLEAELNKIKKLMAQLEPTLLDMLGEAGIPEIAVGNGLKLKPSSLIWAKISDKQKAAQALKDAGYQDYVTEGFNATQVAVILREHIADGQPLPPEFKDIIEPNEVFKLKVVKAT